MVIGPVVQSNNDSNLYSNLCLVFGSLKIKLLIIVIVSATSFYNSKQMPDAIILLDLQICLVILVGTIRTN